MHKMGNLIFDGKGIIGHDLIVKMKRGIEMLLQGFPPITANGTAKESITALTVYGHSTQDGTPSPDNPVPIVSAGDSGEIEVSVGGGQLIKPTGNFPISGRGVTLSQNADGSFHLSGTATSDGNLRIVDPGIESYSLDIKEATLSLIAKNGEFDGTLVLSDAEQEQYWTTLLEVRESNKKTGQVKAGKVGCFVIFTSGKNYDVDLYPMLNIGSTALSFEPYVTPQTLILSTPDGLPGIPVSSGGNYTDENGQQWICNEIDLARGKYVQRVGVETINGGYNFLETSDTPGRFAQFRAGFTNLYKNGGYESICNIALWTTWGEVKDDTAWVFAIHQTGFYLTPPRASGITTADELNAFLNSLGFPLVFVGQLATPIETDLPAEEIAAYKALHTYSPTTTVSNDAAAWMEVGVIME